MDCDHSVANERVGHDRAVVVSLHGVDVHVCTLSTEVIDYACAMLFQSPHSRDVSSKCRCHNRALHLLRLQLDGPSMPDDE
jgi:hypothetical protein